MDYISVKEFAQKYGVSERTARNYCASGKIEGVVLVGKTWNIPPMQPCLCVNPRSNRFLHFFLSFGNRRI